MKTITAAAALLLAMSVGFAEAQNQEQGSEKGPLSHPTAAPGSGVGTRGLDGSTHSPNLRSEPSPNMSEPSPNATKAGMGGSEPSPNKVEDPKRPQK